MSPITTHVLDTHTGKPAAGMPISLYKKRENGEYEILASGVTNHDGRIKNLLEPGTLESGIYKMHFDTGQYFRLLGTRGFYPEAVICFEISVLDEHYHIPLLLSPYGYSTYRGS